MTAQETRELTALRVQVNQLIDSNKRQTEAIETIQKTLDELTGGKQALMWITGISISIAALVIGFINVSKSK